MNRFITRRDEPFAGKEKLVVNICWHWINSDSHDRAGRSQNLLPRTVQAELFHPGVLASQDYRRLQVFQRSA